MWNICVEDTCVRHAQALWKHLMQQIFTEPTQTCKNGSLVEINAVLAATVALETTDERDALRDKSMKSLFLGTLCHSSERMFTYSEM